MSLSLTSVSSADLGESWSASRIKAVLLAPIQRCSVRCGWFVLCQSSHSGGSQHSTILPQLQHYTPNPAHYASAQAGVSVNTAICSICIIPCVNLWMLYMKEEWSGSKTKHQKGEGIRYGIMTRHSKIALFFYILFLFVCHCLKGFPEHMGHCHAVCVSVYLRQAC